MKKTTKKSLAQILAEESKRQYIGIDIFLYLDYSIERQGTQWENNIKQ